MVERLIRPSETQEDREVHTMSRMTRVLFKGVKTLLAHSARYAPVNVGSFLGVVPCCPTDLASPAAVVVTIL